MSELFKMVGELHRAMDYHVQRHSVLASNIANVDTPGFKPLELERVPDQGTSGGLALAATHEAHLPTGSSAHASNRVVESLEQTVQPGLDGNSVSLEREMSKAAANDMRFSIAARLVQKQLALLRYAAQGRGG
ncbi:MAG: flagellar basal body rod protein FlgB [Proteobacteria bacterium]|nr:flagellar basal body rod protein FlgB [Pseudomonadota bacterium]